MEVTARPAQLSDVAELARLRAAASAELGPQRGGRVALRELAGPRRRDWADVIDAPFDFVRLGTIDDCPVGYVWARLICPEDPDGSPTTDVVGPLMVRIHEIYVEPPARGVSVGEHLMGEVLAWGTERDAFGIDAVALPGMRATKNFFEAWGLVARAIIVHRPIGPPGDGGDITAGAGT